MTTLSDASSGTAVVLQPGWHAAGMTRAAAWAVRAAAPLAALTLGPAVLTGCGASPAPLGPAGVDGLTIPTPSPRPADFAGDTENPWFPLRSRDPMDLPPVHADRLPRRRRHGAPRARRIDGVPTTGVRWQVRAAGRAHRHGPVVRRGHGRERVVVRSAGARRTARTLDRLAPSVVVGRRATAPRPGWCSPARRAWATATSTRQPARRRASLDRGLAHGHRRHHPAARTGTRSSRTTSAAWRRCTPCSPTTAAAWAWSPSRTHVHLHQPLAGADQPRLTGNCCPGLPHVRTAD